MPSRDVVLVEPIVQETLPRTASWKAVLFFALFFGFAAFGTLPYRPSDDEPSTTLWATALGRAPGMFSFAHAKPLAPFHRNTLTRNMRMRGKVLRASTAELLDIKNISRVNFLSKAEVPPQIPRDDLIDQLAQWAENEIDENQLGLPMKLERMYKFTDDGVVLWGFKVTIMRDSNVVCDIGWMFDDEIQEKYQFLSKDKDGMPQKSGRREEILGKNLEVWKLDANPVTAEDKVVIKKLCQAASAAVTAYYSFGSVYSDGI